MTNTEKTLKSFLSSRAADCQCASNISLSEVTLRTADGASVWITSFSFISCSNSPWMCVNEMESLINNTCLQTHNKSYNRDSQISYTLTQCRQENKNKNIFKRGRLIETDLTQMLVLTYPIIAVSFCNKKLLNTFYSKLGSLMIRTALKCL